MLRLTVRESWWRRRREYRAENSCWVSVDVVLKWKNRFCSHHKYMSPFLDDDIPSSFIFISFSLVLNDNSLNSLVFFLFHFNSIRSLSSIPAHHPFYIHSTSFRFSLLRFSCRFRKRTGKKERTFVRIEWNGKGRELRQKLCIISTVFCSLFLVLFYSPFLPLLFDPLCFWKKRRVKQTSQTLQLIFLADLPPVLVFPSMHKVKVWEKSESKSEQNHAEISIA